MIPPTAAEVSSMLADMAFWWLVIMETIAFVAGGACGFVIGVWFAYRPGVPNEQ